VNERTMALLLNRLEQYLHSTKLLVSPVSK